MLFSKIMKYVIAAGAVAAAVPSLAVAETTNFKGKVVQVIVGDTAGSSYVNYAQLVQRNLPKQLEGNPEVTVRLMPGAGGIIAGNYLANVAPKDGTVIGALYRGLGTEPLFKGSESRLKFDPRQMVWLYSLNSEVSMAVVWKTTGIHKFDDLYSKELLVASGGVAGDAGVFGSAMNGIMGTKLKMICCYQAARART